eukprot:TRINITY_DN13197_c0_g1_i1.p1 TRINITY_DN13197_c0_g1~~TRINITY_DN13197_c0_g1_i1.p1  ORF type:complete len:542 (-),score=95.13 TRINITY_DN13197_c0_g1_i1:1243-2868(-)
MDKWWQTAVIYQVYPRSFADSNNDGYGDLQGISQNLSSLVSLGIDALWLTPFYPSPQIDGGYDISSYCDVDPLFGTLSDFDVLLSQAHAYGLRVIIDLVPNHTSSSHTWFQSALSSSRGTEHRSKYHFRDEPTDWQSVFGGSAWTQVNDGQHYLHMYDKEQPDLNWSSQKVRDDFVSIIEFWLDRRVDGFRVDVAHGLVKDVNYPSFPNDPLDLFSKENAPYWDQDSVHDIYRSWRKILDRYTESDPSHERILCAEANLPLNRAKLYVRTDEMHQSFNFSFLRTSWNPISLRKVIDDSLEAFKSVGAPSTWVLSNHDVLRHSTRFGYPLESPPPPGVGLDDPQPDRQAGLIRARAATLLMLALPGCAYLYQGEELGLPDSTELSDECRRDPVWFRKNGREKGRDGARVPLPWKTNAKNMGFSNADKIWLPQPESYREYARELQESSCGSTLEMYKLALRLRKEYGLGRGEIVWRSKCDEKVLCFETQDLTVVANLSPQTQNLAMLRESLILVTSQRLQTDHIPPDTTIWLKRSSSISRQHS